ncbi:mCG147122 [Mus musculus]|uniref:Uncharacterized protein n=1 Tax=Mus musculus TaxID=10090 RepID=Q8C300_MOUSE|nr:mCG147122 [Mus musculus]BAC39940.1 unnamed protein product [Mus musculus]
MCVCDYRCDSQRSTFSSQFSISSKFQGLTEVDRLTRQALEPKSSHQLKSLPSTYLFYPFPAKESSFYLPVLPFSSYFQPWGNLFMLLLLSYFPTHAYLPS